MGTSLKRKNKLKIKNRNKKVLFIKSEVRRAELLDTILKWDAKELKQAAKEIDSFEKNIETAEELKEILEATDNGVGIASTQIGNMSRVFITRPDFPKNNTMYTFINPTITYYSEKKITAKEGCLSYPGHSCDVERSESITIKYTDENGNKKATEFNGWHARVIAHEYDHLQGICRVGEDYYKNNIVK